MGICKYCAGGGMVAGPDKDDVICPKCKGAGVREATEAEAETEALPTTGRNVLQRATGRDGNIPAAFSRGSVMRKVAEAVALEIEPIFGLIKAALILAGEIDRDRENGRNHGKD